MLQLAPIEKDKSANILHKNDIGIILGIFEALEI